MAYAVPIIEALIDRVVPRIRALVVVPTRDLAVQVKQTFQELIKGSDLKIGMVIGSTLLSTEQTKIMDRNNESKIDILISTPGRLIDHLQQTRGFNLKHLKFLVLDVREANIRKRTGS